MFFQTLGMRRFDTPEPPFAKNDSMMPFSSNQVKCKTPISKAGNQHKTLAIQQKSSPQNLFLCLQKNYPQKKRNIIALNPGPLVLKNMSPFLKNHKNADFPSFKKPSKKRR